MTPEPSNEYQKLVEALEQARREMIEEGHAGWPNLIEQALSALKIPHAGDAMSEQNVQVTQALGPDQTDINAAAEFLESWEPGPEMTVVKLARAFARHRTRAEPDLVENERG